jgi:hypothetical protein
MPQGARYHPSNNHAGERQAFHRPSTSMGAAGHWIREAGILAPLIIGEFVHDDQQKWRYIRLASLATALLSQGMWTAKIHAERKAAREHGREHHAPA